jgi:hypothetical protein
MKLEEFFFKNDMHKCDGVEYLMNDACIFYFFPRMIDYIGLWHNTYLEGYEKTDSESCKMFTKNENWAISNLSYL